MIDGVYCWPEGLAHYVREHHVRLPHAFVDHALPLEKSARLLPIPEFSQTGMRDREWPAADLRHILWTHPNADTGNGLYIKVDPTWWLGQPDLLARGA